MSSKSLREVFESTKAFRVAISYECPVGCRACYSRKMGSSMMDPSFFDTLLVEGKEFGFNTVSFGGGEPLSTFPLLLDLTRVSKERGYDVSVTTSGFNMTEEMIEQLKDAGLDFIQLSLGFNRKTFDGKIDLLSSVDGTVFGVNFLVAKDKTNRLLSIHESLERRGASYVTYILPKSMDQKMDDLKFNKKQIMAYLRALNKIKETSSLLFLVDCTTSLFEGNDCAGDSKGVSVSPEGKFSFCSFSGKWIPYAKSLENTLKILSSTYNGTCSCIDKFCSID